MHGAAQEPIFASKSWWCGGEGEQDHICDTGPMFHVIWKVSGVEKEKEEEEEE